MSPPASVFPPSVALGVDAQLRQLHLELLAVHADVLGRLRDVALVALERGAEKLALETVDEGLFRPP